MQLSVIIPIFNEAATVGEVLHRVATAPLPPAITATEMIAVNDCSTDGTAEVLTRLHAERDAWYREVADEVLEVGSFHEWGSQPKKAMAERVAELVRAREGAVA